MKHRITHYEFRQTKKGRVVRFYGRTARGTKFLVSEVPLKPEAESKEALTAAKLEAIQQNSA